MHLLCGTLLLAFTVDRTGNGECLRAEAGSSPFGKTACQGHWPCLHPSCLLFMSPATPTRNANTPRPGSRLQISSRCASHRASVPSCGWQRSSIHTPAGLAPEARAGVLLNKNSFEELAGKADSKRMPPATATHSQVDTFSTVELEEHPAQL